MISAPDAFNKTQTEGTCARISNQARLCCRRYLSNRLHKSCSSALRLRRSPACGQSVTLGNCSFSPNAFLCFHGVKKERVSGPADTELLEEAGKGHLRFVPFVTFTCCLQSCTHKFISSVKRRNYSHFRGTHGEEAGVETLTSDQRTTWPPTPETQPL